MQKEAFKAGVHYGDLKGTAAADQVDVNGIRAYLTSIGEMQAGEIPVGIEISAHTVKLPGQKLSFSVKFLVGSFGNYETLKDVAKSGNPVEVRKIDRDMTSDELFALFKNFSIAMSVHGLVDGKEIRWND
jgi:hypothetical protein